MSSVISCQSSVVSCQSSVVSCQLSDCSTPTPHSSLLTTNSTLHTPLSTLHTPLSTLHTPHFSVPSVTSLFYSVLKKLRALCVSFVFFVLEKVLSLLPSLSARTILTPLSTLHTPHLLLFLLLTTLLFGNVNQIQLARVQYDGGGDWYNDPEILPNFADYIAKTLPVNISRREKVVKLSDVAIFQSPFLFLTGHGNIVATDAEVMNLRKYLLSGGFLYVDDDYGFDESFRKLVSRVFPEKSLIELPSTHPLFSAYFQFPNGVPKIHEHDNKRPQLFAVFDDTGRIMIIYTYESNISDGWADYDTHQNPPEVREKAFQFGLNIFYHLFVESD